MFRTILLVAVMVAVTQAQRKSLKERRTTVMPELKDKRALKEGLIDLQFCGEGSESQISRGPLACGFPVVGDHPWLVTLGFRGRRGRVIHSCSGALISDQYVVTTARCARGSHQFQLVSVRLGEYDFSSTQDCLWYDPTTCTKAEEVAVERVAAHPQFDPRSSRYQAHLFDVAVLKLARKVTIRHGVRPICLPMYPLRHAPHRQFALTMGLLTGREPEGDAAAACCECDRDRSTTTHVMDEQQLSLYNSSYDGADCRYQLLAETLEQPAQCLGGGPDTASCMADLGGPLVAADRFGSAFFLMGVASMRPSSRDCSRRPVTYAPVRPHMGWILDSMDKLNKPVSTPLPTPLRPRTSTRGKVSLSGTRPISPRLEATRRIAARKQSNPASRGWVWN